MSYEPGAGVLDALVIAVRESWTDEVPTCVGWVRERPGCFQSARTAMSGGALPGARRPRFVSTIVPCGCTCFLPPIWET
jgi:hypothetical protein